MPLCNRVHLCFGLFQRFDVQNVDLTLELAAGAVATFRRRFGKQLEALFVQVLQTALAAQRDPA